MSELVLDGLAHGFQRHIAGLFQTLMAAGADPDSLERFGRGIDKAITAYEDAVAVATAVIQAKQETAA
jgi:hypothetical protein